MLERMWRRGNTFVLLMGMQIDIAIMEDGMEIPLKTKNKTTINSVQFSHSLVSDSFQSMDCNMPGFPVHHQFLEPTQTQVHRVSDAIQPSHPLSYSFFSHLQSFPASDYFPMNCFFTSGGQSIGVSASAWGLPMNIQDWFLLGWTGWISLLSKRLSRVFSNTTVQKH